jgi:outer membrane protein assembly factor BamB
MKATVKIIGKLIGGCVLACCLTSNIQAQLLPPGITNNGDGGTNTYDFYPGFNPTPVITYPTNITLKWNLAMPSSPLVASLSLAPDGTLYAVNDQILSAIDTSTVSTNDANYPSQNDFTKWFANDRYWSGDGTTPAVGADGTIYASLSGDSFFAINPTNGAVLWSFRATPPVSFFRGAQPAVGVDGTVYIGGENYVGSLNPNSDVSFFYALTNAFGKTNYYTDTGLYPYLLINVGIKWIFVLTNGAQLFSGAAPAVGRDGTIYVNELTSSEVNDAGTSGTGLYALNATNGMLLWHTSPLSGESIGGRGATGPAIGPDGTIYYGIGTNFVAINPNAPVTNGVMSFKWIYANTGIGFNWHPVVGYDGTVYVEANSSTVSYQTYPIAFISTNLLFAFNATPGVPKWINNLSPTNYYGIYWKSGSLAIAADGEIILADADGTLYSFSPNGKINWSNQTGPQALNSPLIGPDGTIYVQSIDGDTATCYVYAFAGTSPIACGSWPEDGRNARRTAAVATASVLSPMMTTNGFQFTITGPTNMPVCPCASSDLTTWTNIGQTFLTGGSTNFVDIVVSNYPYRFYEARPQ